MKKKVKKKLHSYIFTFHEYDKEKVVTITAAWKTEPISAKQARIFLDLKTEEISHFSSNRFCYSVHRDEELINPKDLK